MGNHYHYTESGLDNVYLVNGFKFFNGPRGRAVSFRNLDGLHRTIALGLVSRKARLSGRELRFLRINMLMSQATVAALFDVAEQTVHRWEAGKTEIPGAVDQMMRLRYRAYVGNESLRRALKRISDLEDDLDGMMMLTETDEGWELAA